MVEIELMHPFHLKIDPRRRQEQRDARMIAEDHAATANLPEKPIYHEFDAWKDVERLGY